MEGTNSMTDTRQSNVLTSTARVFDDVHGSDKNQGDAKSTRNVWVAAKTGDVELLRQLVEVECQPHNLQDMHEKDPFYYACVCSQPHALKYLQERNMTMGIELPDDVRKLCSLRTPSEDIWAFLAGHKTIDEVIEGSEKTEKLRLMSVWDAAKVGELAKLRRVLKNEPENIAMRDLDQCTPLFYACKHNHPSAVAVLLDSYLKATGLDEANEELEKCRGATKSVEVLQVLDGKLTLKDIMRKQKERTKEKP